MKKICLALIALQIGCASSDAQDLPSQADSVKKSGSNGSRIQPREREHRPQERAIIQEARRGEWRVELSPGMRDAIRKFNRYFEPWEAEDYRGISIGSYERSSRQVPWAVAGDFNSDDIIDLAIAGRTDDEIMVLMLLSDSGAAFTIRTMDIEPYDGRSRKKPAPPVLRYIYPGKYRVEYERWRDDTRKLENDSRRGDKSVLRERQIEIRRPAVQLSGGHRKNSGAVVFMVESGELAPYYLIRGLIGGRPDSRSR